MKTIDISDSDRNLLQICLEIARAKFQGYSALSMHPRVTDQFARQATDADRLLNLIAGAERVTVEPGAPDAT